MKAQSRPRPVPRTTPACAEFRSRFRITLPTASPANQAVAGREVLRGLSSWPPRKPVPALPPAHSPCSRHRRRNSPFPLAGGRLGWGCPLPDTAVRVPRPHSVNNRIHQPMLRPAKAATLDNPSHPSPDTARNHLAATGNCHAQPASTARLQLADRQASDKSVGMRQLSGASASRAPA